MPRIKQYAEAYAKRDFQKEIAKAQVQAELTKKKDLAEATGIPYSTLWKRLDEPGDISLSELRTLLKVLPIPAEALLDFVGYKPKEIGKVVNK